MPEDYRSYVDRIVDSFPPLTDDQRGELRVLLAGRPAEERTRDTRRGDAA